LSRLQKSESLLRVVGLAFLVLSISQMFAPALEYDRVAILHGELWRVITGHLTHLGWRHLLLNLLGAILVLGLFGAVFRPRIWCLGGMLCALGISLTFLLLAPELDWYRGLSGVIHSLLVMGLIGAVRQGKRLYLLGMAVLIVKLMADSLFGGSAIRFDFQVIALAHVSGAFWGLMVAAMACLFEVSTNPPGRATVPTNRALPVDENIPSGIS